jgi:hypothetical protein
MFTPLEHAILRDVCVKPKPKNKVWRVYGDKTNYKTGITRRYYMCTECREARYVAIHKSGELVDTKDIHAHAFNCSHRP